MGIPVLILGESGSGKSTSMRNFEPGELFVFNVAGKPLPFRKHFGKSDTPSYHDIQRELSNPAYKRYVIDDSQYLLAFEMFDRAKDTGYTKFTDMAIHFRNLIDFVIKQTPPDVIVYFMHHTEIGENGRVKAKTVGKMLDNQLTVEGLFSVVLMASVEGNEHFFITQSDGYTTCKSPLDMFETKIDNDLAFVDQTIREYWEIPNDIDHGEYPISKENWMKISKAAGNVGQIAEKAYKKFGYGKATEIKLKDLQNVIREAEGLYKKYQEGRHGKDQDTGKADGEAEGADS